MVVLDTPRLYLRPPEERDLEAYVEIHEDPEVLKYLRSTGDAAGRVAGWRTIAMILGHWHLRGYGHWTVVEKATGDVIGRVGPCCPEGWNAVELGWLIRRSHWRRGFATEAARAAIEFTFAETDVDHLVSRISTNNLRSVRVAEKIGERLNYIDTSNGEQTFVYGIRRAAARPTAPGLVTHVSMPLFKCHTC